MYRNFLCLIWPPCDRHLTENVTNLPSICAGIAMMKVVLKQWRRREFLLGANKRGAAGAEIKTRRRRRRRMGGGYPPDQLPSLGERRKLSQ